MTMEELDLESAGARQLAGAALDVVPELAAIAERTAVSAGTRLVGDPALRGLLDRAGRIGAIAATRMGSRARPVRAILFDKSARSNWSLAWHQDRTIAVRSRREVPGFGPWTVKSGMTHVAPPINVLESMLTLRVHLDDVADDNAPLLVALGSHRLGRIAEKDIEQVVASCRVVACTAAAGDVWLYSTPILHASEKTRMPHRRRVLQVDYAARDLPGGLEWLGV